MAQVRTSVTGVPELDRAIQVIEQERSVKVAAAMLGVAGLVVGLFLLILQIA